MSSLLINESSKANIKIILRTDALYSLFVRTGAKMINISSVWQGLKARHDETGLS